MSGSGTAAAGLIDTSLQKRIEYDLYYIQHWSLAFDLKIMALTVVKGFVHENAH